ncbi:MAG: anion permease [Actinomycetota bacterium]
METNTMLFVLLASFFSMNMGASGFATSMAAPYGARFLDRKACILLFSLFVALGALLAGKRVTRTLATGMFEVRSTDIRVALIVMAAATLSLFAANLLRVPQSTSQVTVAALAGVGWRMGWLRADPFKLMIPLWLALPIAAYLLTLVAGKSLYPRLRWRVMKREPVGRYRLLFLLVVASSCYAAFSIGSNNVANVVGPLVGSGMAGPLAASLLAAPIFGMGGLVLGKGNLQTAGRELVPLGVLSSSLVSAVGASLLLLASALGMPASEVQIKLGAIFAVGVVKNGHRAMFRNQAARRAALVWVVAPLFSLAFAYLMALHILKP